MCVNFWKTPYVHVFKICFEFHSHELFEVSYYHLYFTNEGVKCARTQCSFLATVVEVKVKENFRTGVYLVWHQISDDVCVNHQYGWNIRFRCWGA